MAAPDLVNLCCCPDRVIQFNIPEPTKSQAGKLPRLAATLRCGMLHAG